MANTHSTDLESGSSQSWSITDASQTGLDISGDFSIEFWIKPESLQDCVFIDKTDGVGGYRVATGDAGNDSIVVQYWDGSSNKTEKRATGVLTGETGNWVHIAVTVDVSTQGITIYKDTVSQSITSNTTGASTVGTNSEPFVIGSDSTTSNYYDGIIDDVRVWNDIRTSGEISTNYNTELVGNEAGLVAYWKFNNNGTDTNANGNDLTNNNSATFSTDVPFSGAAGGEDPAIFFGATF